MSGIFYAAYPFTLQCCLAPTGFVSLTSFACWKQY